MRYLDNVIVVEKCKVQEKYVISFAEISVLIHPYGTDRETEIQAVKKDGNIITKHIFL